MNCCVLKRKRKIKIISIQLLEDNYRKTKIFSQLLNFHEILNKSILKSIRVNLYFLHDALIISDSFQQTVFTYNRIREKHRVERCFSLTSGNFGSKTPYLNIVNHVLLSPVTLPRSRSPFKLLRTSANKPNASISTFLDVTLTRIN